MYITIAAKRIYDYNIIVSAKCAVINLIDINKFPMFWQNLFLFVRMSKAAAEVYIPDMLDDPETSDGRKQHPHMKTTPHTTKNPPPQFLQSL